MHPDHSLISTIAVGLAFAFVGGWLAIKVKLPALVGYLIAGILVGPFTPGFVADQKLAPQLAEIGVILLMFGVGMHFSLKDLWSVQHIAGPGAMGQMIAATLMGAGLAVWWGWSWSSGILFGLTLSVASTVVLLRALQDANLLHTSDGKIAIGWLIVEDLLMVLALVILPALGVKDVPADQQPNLWLVIGYTLLKVALFMVVMIFIGMKLLPWILHRVNLTGSKELFTLAVVTLSLGIAYLAAELFGVSFALGAFFAGIVVHESDLNHQAEQELQPLQNVFSALFFVSVGMLFDPQVLAQSPFKVLLVALVIMVGKSLAALAIVLLLRKPWRTAIIIAISLAQIGEFSFILASLGLTLKLLSAEAQNLIVAGAILSITLNPLLFWWGKRMVRS